MSNRGIWTKSSYSQANPDGNCVEVAVCARTVRIRDSKRISGRILAVPSAAWAEFIAKVGERP
ncbi:DUF397 domain-containing protein [Streptomyces orinoci]|uniref:DUF397 domain-containing protein n=1 Tax=Streptomyces orinoci TaxID=67339 RepID=A0ABV3K6H1_STRON|nr:DUF397 domain-containing protein [Streptomyces orinoci]